MNFNEYQEFTKSLAVYNTEIHAFNPATKNSIHMPWTYPVMALAEEAGEVNGKVAKFIRKYGTDTAELQTMVCKELGDVMYQLSEAARMFGLSLDDVVRVNVEKLSDRADRGVLVGEGDER